jgi:SAM-dependent methyltransferase
MNSPITTFSTKAKLYASYRWDYAQPAIQAIFGMAELHADSTVADLGAGTGILTRHFAGKVARLYAIEPNAAMRLWASAVLKGYPGCCVLAGCAEAIPLEAGSVDLVAVAQAIHWFDPEPARAEIRRILKTGGWLALLRNYCTDEGLNRAIETISTTEHGFNKLSSMPGSGKKPQDYYFDHAACSKFTYPFTLTQDWTAFIGSLLSASNAPEVNDPRYLFLEKAARNVFEQVSIDGLMKVSGQTELLMGQVDLRKSNANKPERLV